MIYLSEQIIQIVHVLHVWQVNTYYKLLIYVS